jgi:hypothetical protein
MGMFDDIVCKYPLPFPEDTKGYIPNGFQTKDLDCGLDFYEIREDGTLWLRECEREHIDGDPNNNDPKNLQTLCSNCHDLKTHLFRDWATPGRRERKTIPGSARVIAAVKKRRSISRYSTLPL